MEFLSRYASQIRIMLGNLTISQRLSIGLLVVVMLGTIYLVVVSSARPEMVELLPGTHPSPEEVSVMTAFLKGKYPYETKGDQILVPVDKQYEIRGALAAAQALPRNTTAAFTKLAEANDYFMPEASIERRWNLARQEVLATVLRNFPYISDATVFITKGESRGLGRDPIRPRASVNVRLKGEEALTSNQLMAIVETVRGANAGMSREDVVVTDGHRAYTMPNEDAPIATGLQEFKKNAERDLTEKLLGQLGWVPNVKVAVNVVPDWTHQTIHEKKVDSKGIAKATIRESSEESTSTDGNAGGGQPGVGSNVSASVGSSGGGSRGGSSSSVSTTENQVEIPGTVSEIVKVPGAEIKRLTASISVPRSWFVALYRRMQKDEKAEPDDNDAAFQALIKQNLDKIQLLAKSTIGAEADGQISVAWFDDVVVVPMQAATAGGGGLSARADGGSAMGMMMQYGKQAILGGIALGALMMMLMMVRKAAPSTAGVEADAGVFLGVGGGKKKPRDPAALEIDEDVIGEAGTGEAVLTGIELDDETLQSRKMVDEVSTMIKENPESAAALIKKWMSKNK